SQQKPMTAKLALALGTAVQQVRTSLADTSALPMLGFAGRQLVSAQTLVSLLQQSRSILLLVLALRQFAGME
ncbi:hypothetical protein, partial [Streptococcus pseudopneumoniae]|uniref:hypothetical protein n=1 Tax=Streptococcus pseudopneumoniae TaxID=257758 RepID=UPI0019D6865D